MASETDVRFAVENMFPWKAASREFAAYVPSWDVRDDDYLHTTLDLSHTSVSGSDALEMARDLGERLVHVHLADGSGSSRDEHLVPGRGNQPCAELLQGLGQSEFDGQVVVEISTRKAVDRGEREGDLREALDFARRNLAGHGEHDVSEVSP
jgi:sugar phosphate isomerase/epimerase